MHTTAAPSTSLPAAGTHLTGQHAFKLKGDADLNNHINIMPGAKVFIDGQGASITIRRYRIIAAQKMLAMKSGLTSLAS